MSTPISNDYDTVSAGARRASDDASTPLAASASAPGIDPRLHAVTEDARDRTRRLRDRVRDGADRTDRYTRGLESLQEEGGDRMRDAGPGMPLLPTGVETAPPTAAPQPAYAAPMPMAAPPPMPAPVAAPSGVTMIDPGLLAALVAATQARASADAAEGIAPSLTGSVASGSSATGPQPRQPLDLSQVSLEKFPAGQLSREQTAAVIDQALTINGVPNDPQLRAQWHQLYQHMADGESSRNPNAVNIIDDNAVGPRAADGAPSNSSRGIWQCIPTTFAQYHMAGTSTSIYDPVASASASIRYVMDQYHVRPTGEGLAAFAAGRGLGTGTYRGY